MKSNFQNPFSNALFNKWKVLIKIFLYYKIWRGKHKIENTAYKNLKFLINFNLAIILKKEILINVLRILVEKFKIERFH